MKTAGSKTNGSGRTAEKVTINQKPADPSVPGLCILLSYEEHWPTQYNTLLMDGQKHFYLADSEHDDTVQDAKFPYENIPLSKVTRSMINQVTVKEALEWYALVNDFSMGSIGSVQELCEAAARRL